jgi:hypothetical protein
MPIAEDIELEAPSPEEAVDREELARLVYWHWEMRTQPENRPEEDWFWAEEEELRRHRLTAGDETDVAW